MINLDGPDAFRWCSWCEVMVPTLEWRLTSTRLSIIHIGNARWCLDEDPGPCNYRDRIPVKQSYGS